MARFPSEARVAVFPYAARDEGINSTIGDPARGVFLTIPAQGRELLDALAAGRTVGEAVAGYELAHGETPDVEDFLGALAELGFVAVPGRPSDPADAPAAAGLPAGRQARRGRGWTLSTLALFGLLSAGGVALVAGDPSLIPGSTALVFHRDVAVLSLALLAAGLAGLAIHELAHLLAARAAGVTARIGVGHRLWFLVAETDMSGIWLAPERWRYLSFTAGPLVDGGSASLLLGLLWAAGHGWLGLSPLAAQFLQALVWTYLLRLLWQCFVFVRTDFYYVLATALRCKRLLADTEDVLRNGVAHLRGRPAPVDQSAIPARELRVIRAYSLVWLGGRLAAVASLVLITFPVLAGYARELVSMATGAHTATAVIDVLTLAALTAGVQLAGLLVWLRSLYQTRLRRSI